MYQYDSRKIKKGDTYICLKGGEPYIEDAKKNGANEVLHLNRKEMGELSAAYFSQPSKKLSVVAVTGTNGKSSVCHFVAQALTLMGYKPYVQGTLTHRLTTPESLDTLREMKKHVDNGGTHFIMEVSSHGIAQDRLSGIDFTLCCLTNISQDHLDFHGTFEHYKQSKLRFMKANKLKSIYPSSIQSAPIINNPKISGNFNQKNLKMAYLILSRLCLDVEKIKESLSKINGAPGRFEEIPSKAPFRVFVDYAHTPDGLRVVLQAATHLKKKQSKLLCCFGCGGDRDKGKREKMGKIASDLCDFVVLTQDNPRTEDPDVIIKDIQKGIDQKKANCENDRKKAIQLLLNKASENDIVVIAGKGHEKMQIIGNIEHPFDDKDVTLTVLKEMGY